MADEIIICDTNIFIEVYRGNSQISLKLSEIGYENIAVSDVTRAELLYGARNRNELSAITKDLNQFVHFSIISTISKFAVELISKYSLSHNLNLPDALIAATAIYEGKLLYTLNKKDFKFIEDVRLFEAN
ncbi:MAG: putative nucleic acid-binding protein [Spirosomataceae bacterium]|jgi:predicted nucleic acid-binding protein